MTRLNWLCAEVTIKTAVLSPMDHLSHVLYVFMVLWNKQVKRMKEKFENIRWIVHFAINML